MESLPDEKRGCHHTGFEKNCRDLVISGRCTRWIWVETDNAQTGEKIREWDCADNWVPVMLIVNAREIRQGAAAMESFRNEVHTGNEVFGALLSQKQQKLLER